MRGRLAGQWRWDLFVASHLGVCYHPRVSKIDPLVLLLTALTLIMIVALFLAEWWFRQDGAFFQAIAGITATTSGALFMRVKPQGSPDPTHKVQVSQSPGESSVEVKS